LSQVSQQLMKHRTKGGFECYGELLYAEGMERKNELERQQREREAEKEAEELRELSLKPSMSHGTKRMINKNAVPLWERLQDANDEKQAKLQVSHGGIIQKYASATFPRYLFANEKASKRSVPQPGTVGSPCTNTNTTLSVIVSELDVSGQGSPFGKLRAHVGRNAV